MRTIETRLAAILLCTTVLLTTGAREATAIPLSGLIGHWRLDESSGLTANDSAGTANGTLVNFVGNEWTTGVINNALPFNRPSSQYITVNGLAGQLSTGDDYTVTAWFNTTTSGLGNFQHQIFSAHDAVGNNIFRLGTDNDGGIFLNSGATDQTSGSGWNDGAWHLVTASRTGGTTTVTVDAAVLSGFSGNPAWSSATQYSIGQEYDAAVPTDFFDGLLDDLTLWNRALTLSEIEEIHENGLAGFSIEGAPFVPEPSTLWLLVLGALSVARPARRRRARKPETKLLCEKTEL